MLQVRCANPTGTGEPTACPYASPVKGRCRTDEGRLTEGLLLSREITLGTTPPQSACASQLPPFAPKRLFKPFRCCAWLISYRQRTALSVGKRSCFRFAALTLRVTSHRNVPSGHSGVPHGLFSVKSTSCSSLQNAHASGSLRSPCGDRGAELRVLMPPLCKGRCRTDEGRLTEGLPLSQNLPPERREARRRRASRQECGLRPAKGRGAHSCPPKPLGRKTHTTRTRRRT